MLHSLQIKQVKLMGCLWLFRFGVNPVVMRCTHHIAADAVLCAKYSDLLADIMVILINAGIACGDVAVIRSSEMEAVYKPNRLKYRFYALGVDVRSGVGFHADKCAAALHMEPV